MGAVGSADALAESLSPLRERDSCSRSEQQGEGMWPDRNVLLARARWMRANPTEAEKLLWYMLRDRRLAAFKFRRQQIIYPYIVDFICIEQRLIIEADGSQHSDNKADLRRDAFLRAQDFRVLRFWNNHILGDSDALGSAIYDALTSPHPDERFALVCPSPAEGRGTI